jgi:nitroreductase
MHQIYTGVDCFFLAAMAKTATEKPLSEILRERRSTPAFDPTPVHETDLHKILHAGLGSPSGYNLQPWRFIVIRDPGRRKQLRPAVHNQMKVEQAPVVVVACGDPEGWRTGDLDEMLRLADEHGYGDPSRRAKARATAEEFLSGPNIEIWLARNVMLAFTQMMLMAEALGYNTAPIEGFDEEQVRGVLNVPKHVRVIALLAIGYRQGPAKPYGGRFASERVCFEEEWGRGMKL